MEDKNPSRKVGELDNRGSHFLPGTLYWAQALAWPRKENAELKAEFTGLWQQTLASHGIRYRG